MHTQPPLFDSIRALIAFFVNGEDTLELQYRVDKTIYLIWAIAYGVMAVVIYLWLSKITGLVFAATATALFMGSPPVILYATLLETTFLSAFFVLFFYYLKSVAERW